MPKKTLNNVNIAPVSHADFVTKSQQFITKSIRHGRFPNDSLRNRKQLAFKPNLNADLTLIEYSKITFNLINQQKAVQNCDALLNDNASHNYCITDQAIEQSKKLGEAINDNLHQMALEQASTFQGLQAKARILKAATSPLSFDEGYLNYECSLLLTSLLMDILAGDQQC